MMCQACERGDHHECGMQTWCECDCAGYGEFDYIDGDEPWLDPINYDANDGTEGGS